MASRRTQLLVLLIIAAGVAVVFTYVWEDGQHAAAAASVEDLVDCREKISDLAKWGGPGSSAPLTSDDSELNRRLHAAAADAGVPDALASIDPGQPRPLKDSDYEETLIFLRLNGVNIHQLVQFLHQLSVRDSNLRTKNIELSIPQGQPADSSGDTWTADVTLSFLNYAPVVRAK